jgi:outer membrane protein TolC
VEAVMRHIMHTAVAAAVLVVLAPRSANAGAANHGDATGDEVAEDRDADVARRAVHGPPISALLAAAYAAAGIDHDPKDSWIRRARLAGLVPWVTVRTTRDTSWQDDQSEVGHGTSLELRATWRLDRLLFDGKELQVAAVEAARHRERRRLAARVIRAYFAWRRAASIASDDERVVTRVAETVAELDALTDGWFSDQLRPRTAATAR